MPPAAETFFFALSGISTTFVGFSALIMMLRQSLGDGLSEFDAWITRVFVQLGFLVTAGAMTPSLLSLCGLSQDLMWRACSGGVGLIVAIFVITYPGRRRAVSGDPAPAFVWLDLILLTAAVGLLGSNAAAWPIAANPGRYAAGLSGVLFVGGLGYLHAIGGLRWRRRGR